MLLGNFRTKLFLTLVIIVLIATVSLPVSIAQSSHSMLFDKIDWNINEYMKTGNIPGLSISMMKNDSIMLLKGYGYSDFKNETSVTSATLFELGSCSKAFTALGFMKLVNEGLVNLDDSVSTYLSWFHVTYEGQSPYITVSQLLHHTSGIPKETISDIPQDSSRKALEKTVRKIVGIELNNLPGEVFEYASVNYDIIGLIIEKITGMSYEDYMRKAVFIPLGMKNTTVGLPKKGLALAKGYKIGFFSPLEYTSPVFRGNAPAGYIVTNAEDMAIWLKHQMGVVNSEFDSAIMKTHERDKTVPPNNNFSSYAMGWEVSLNGDNKISHGGLNPNYSAYMAINPITKVGIVVLANSNSNYTNVIGDYLFKTMHGQEYMIKSNYDDEIDKSFSILSIIFSFIILAALAYAVYIFVLILKGKRKYSSSSCNKLTEIIAILALLIPISVGIILFPKAIAGFSWEAILIWAPISFSIFIQILIVAIFTTLFLYFFSNLFPHPNIYWQSAPVLVTLSIISGVANMVVILLITSSVGKTEIKYNLFYFLLVFGIYILGRKIVQTRLYKITMLIVYDFRKNLIDKIFSSSYQDFENTDRGQVYTTLNDDTSTLGNSAAIIVGFLTSIITVFGAFIFLATISFWATLVTLVIITAIGLIYNNVSTEAEVHFEKARDSQNVYLRLVNDMIDGFRELSLHRKKKHEYKQELLSASNTFRRRNIFANIKYINVFLIGQTFMIFALGTVAFGFAIFFPHIESYKLVSFVVILLYLIGPVSGILMAIPALTQLKVAWNRIQQFLKSFDNVTDNERQAVSLHENISTVDNLRLKGVNFEYNNREGINGFNIGPVDFSISKGEILFIIGGNGSGKTTLAKLITGLYKPDRGKVEINGMPVNESLGEYFSTVLSPFHLFEKMYNVDLNGKADKINNYLKVLGLDRKVQINENKFSTIELSVGQRKRLALLQCYLEDHPIYLFDEWAADQDPEYRRFFYRELMPEMKKTGKIVIAITHDEHYFDVADKVLKMDMGKVEFVSSNYKAESVL